MKYDSIHPSLEPAHRLLGRQLAAQQTISLLSSLGALGVASAWFRSTASGEARPSHMPLSGGAASPIIANNFAA